MKRLIVALAVSSALLVANGTAIAQTGGGGKPNRPPKTQPAPKPHGGPAANGGGPVVRGGAAHRPKAPAAQAMKGPKTTTPHGPKPARAGGSKPATHGTAAAAPKKSNTRTTTTTTTTTGTTMTLTAVQQKLQRNTNLARRLEARLPAGSNLMTAAEGFRNLGQFVAAVNVSHNLDIPFSQLKSRMVDDGMSLGQAIQSLRGSVDVTTEVRRAETEATRILTETERSTTTVTTANKKKDRGR